MSDKIDPARGASGNRDMLSVAEAAHLVRVSRRTLYKLIQQNAIDYTRTASGRVRIYTESLLRPKKGSAGSTLSDGA